MNRLKYVYITAGLIAFFMEFFSKELLLAEFPSAFISILPRILWMIALVFLGVEFGYRKGKGKGR